jgi:NADH-quinone oxidoreductase subunit F
MILSRIEYGRSRKGDLELLESLASRINMHTLCPLGDALCGPLESIIRKFRREFEWHVEAQKCIFMGKSILVSH